MLNDYNILLNIIIFIIPKIILTFKKKLKHCYLLLVASPVYLHNMFPLLESHYMFNLTKELTNEVWIQDVYDSLENGDLSEPAFIMFTLLKNDLPPFNIKNKNTYLSKEYRTEGNHAYKSKKYQVALVLYNKAIAYAPYGSRAMVLAYSNRSALLITTEQYKACLDDISTCMSLGCPDDIMQKIKLRRETAQNNLWMENLKKNSRICEFAENFYKLPKRHPDIPCASSNIDIIMYSKVPKIVAKTDIKVGTLLAIEEAFAISPFTYNKSDRIYTLCYYCFKMSLNLLPCEGCCFALFCSKDCKKSCMKEYHSVECKVIQLVELRNDVQIPLRAAIKMRNMCRSWDEFIAHADQLDVDNSKTYSVKEMYDSNNVTSLFSFNRYLHFVHGLVFNTSLIWTVFIITIEKIGGFFPENDKEAAIRAFTRTLMHLSLFANPTHVILSESQTDDNSIRYNQSPCFGLFPFIGKLKHSCIPNTRLSALNKHMALIAMQPIKAGTELTLSSVYHWLDFPQSQQDRSDRMWWFYRTVCSCTICNTNPHEWVLRLETDHLSVAQKRRFKNLDLKSTHGDFYDTKIIANAFKKVCECMELLRDVPFSKEYMDTYRHFRTCLLFLQNYKSQNLILDGTS